MPYPAQSPLSRSVYSVVFQAIFAQISILSVNLDHPFSLLAPMSLPLLMAIIGVECAQHDVAQYPRVRARTTINHQTELTRLTDALL